MFRRNLSLLLTVVVLATLLALPASGANIAYRIEKGDTLRKVAEDTGLPLEDLLAWNEWVEDPDAVLKVGKLVVLRNPYGRSQFEDDAQIKEASEVLKSFYSARIAKDKNLASKYASEQVLKKYSDGEEGLSLFGSTSPAYSRFAVLKISKSNGSFLSTVRVYEKAGGKEVGFFDERVTLFKVDGSLKVVDASRSGYTNVYVVERGENLWTISKKLGNKSDKEITNFIKQVTKLNDISEKDVLRVHQVLILP